MLCLKFYVIYNKLSFFTEKYEKSPLLIFSPPTFVMTEECVDNFVLSLDAIIRVGGAISNDECDDAEQINAALASAGKKYGVHFQGEEATVICNLNNEYVGSSISILFRGTFGHSEKCCLNHLIGRYRPDLHFCFVPGCWCKKTCCRSTTSAD